MTFELNHDTARKLAKALMTRTGREIKLKDIYDDIGSLFGMKGDAMMHALKKGSGERPTSWGESVTSDTASPIESLSSLVDRIEAGQSTGILFSVIFVGSFQAICERDGHAAGAEHVRMLAEHLKGPSDDLFVRRRVADIGGGYLAFVVPISWDDDLPFKANRPLTDWVGDEQRLQAAPPPPGREEYELGGCCWAFEVGRFSRERLMAKLDAMKVSAENQMLARRELRAFPIVRVGF